MDYESFDDDEVDIDALKKVRFDDYDIEEIDRQSLKEIKRMLIEKQYKDAQTIKDHMDFLEKLSVKLQNMHKNEAEIGYQNLEVASALKQVNNLRQHLVALLESL